MIQSLLKPVDELGVAVARDRLPQTIARRTRRVYDILAGVYPLSTFFFHSNAHRCAVEVSGLRDGMQVLEVATGSGEMFHRLVEANRSGLTMGLDLSPNMAAHTLRRARRDFPNSWTSCQAVDARYLPFRRAAFDAIFCCYLFELLAADDILMTLDEFRRVLRPGGTLTVVCIGQNAGFFNRLYRFAGTVAPAFWGRQVEERIDTWLEEADFRVVTERPIKQNLYPSRVVLARR
jgi:ubiquinone/menaquinone biosynthesis C-methylase UbiE